MPLFRFAQIEVPWPLGPPDGRYLVRDRRGEPQHVIVLATLGAARRRGRFSRARRPSPPEPAASPVATGRATVIWAAEPLGSGEAGEAWLRSAGEESLSEALLVLAEMLFGYRAAAWDPWLAAVGREHLLVARIGFGDGEQVAYGRWRSARELVPARRSRRRMLDPTTRLAALLAGRDRVPLCEELCLQSRLSADGGRWRVAALLLDAALGSAVLELADDPGISGARLDELRERHASLAALATLPPERSLSASEQDLVRTGLRSLEAALRSRAALR